MGNTTPFDQLTEPALKVLGHQPGRLIPLSILLFTWAFLTEPLAAAQKKGGPCDQDLIRPNENPLGYKIRGAQGDRCEGQYIEQVASTALSVASFTKTFEDYDLDKDRPLQIAWPGLGEQEIRLRAHGIKWRLYYRMDTIRSPGSTTFEWPIGILSALNIPKRDIGIKGWTEMKLGAATQRVYLPLHVTQSGALPPSQGVYRLVLWPGVQFREVYVSVTSLDDKGRPKEVLQEGKPLNYGFYPAQRAIPVSLRRFRVPGIYKVTISATMDSGTDTSVTLRVYHSES